MYTIVTTSETKLLHCRRTFTDHNSILLRKGQTLKRPLLARTLEILAKEGSDSFYRGALGETIVGELQQKGGIITMEDLQNYKYFDQQQLC